MDQNYIRVLSESFSVDYNMEDKENEINEFFQSLMAELKEEDYTLYRYMHEISKTEQLEIAQFLFEEEFLEEENEEIEEVDMGVLALGGVVGIFFALAITLISDKEKRKKFWDEIKKTSQSLIKSTRNMIQSGMDYVHDKKKRERVITAVYQNNLKKCFVKCGAKEMGKVGFIRKLSLLSLRKPSDEESERLREYFLTEKHKDEARCMLNCYLDYMTSLFAQLAYTYRQCLEKTGEQLPTNTPDTFTVLTKYPVGGSCQTMYDELINIQNNFNEILDYMFENDRQEKNKWINILDEKVRKINQGQDITKVVQDFS